MTDALFRVLQNKSIDIASCCVQLCDTIAYMERQSLEFDNFYQRFEEKCATLGLTNTDDDRNFT